MDHYNLVFNIFIGVCLVSILAICLIVAFDCFSQVFFHYKELYRELSEPSTSPFWRINK